MPPFPRHLRAPHVALRLAMVFAAACCVLRAQTPYTSYKFTTLAGKAGVAGKADGTGGAALFTNPSGVAVDPSGNLYVTDSSNNTIRKVTSSGIVTTLAGTALTAGAADGQGGAALFYGPRGIAIDAAGNLYVADSQNNTIRKITPAGAVSTLAGTAGTFGSTDGTGPDASFYEPSGVAVDAAGNVYVSEFMNGTIRKITPAGVVTTLAGSAIVQGAYSDGTGARAFFNGPQGISLDTAGNLYVADTRNQCIRKVTPAGVVTTLGGFSPALSYSGPWEYEAELFFPSAVAVDAAGNLYVTDSGNCEIRKLTPEGALSTVAGIPGLAGGTDGVGPSAEFSDPWGIIVDPAGTLYVADWGNDTIRRGTAVSQAQATIILSQLSQAYDGTPKIPSVTTSPAGLATLIAYGPSSPGVSGPNINAPWAQGTYPVFATIADPNYTGSVFGSLTISPGLPAHTAILTRNSSPGKAALWGIAAGPSGLVAVGENGLIMGSTDGAAWTTRSSGTTNWLTAVAYGGGQYIAVGDKGTVLLSPDSQAWVSIAQSATASRLNNVIFAAGQYVAVGEAGAIITSSDGLHWTARSSGVTGWLRGLTYAAPYAYFYGPTSAEQVGFEPAHFVAAGQAGAFVGSTDGVAWTDEGATYGAGPWDLSPGADVEALLAGQDQGDAFAASGAGGYSGTGIWEQMNGTAALGGLGPPKEYLTGFPIPSSVDFRALTACGGSVYAAGQNGALYANRLAIANFTGPWQELVSGTASNLNGAAAIGDSVFFVGADQTILELTAPFDSRLINISCRANVGGESNALITGFVVGGGGTSGAVPLLIRGSGPALAAFGITGPLADPEIKLFATSQNSLMLSKNDGWGGLPSIVSEAASVGAFAWASSTSHDAALAPSLGSGSYTANVFGESGDSGVALTEVYDATPAAEVGPTTPRLINISARNQVGTGGSVLIAGFVVGGTTPKTVLIRASGPALAPFRVTGTLPDPKLQLFGSDSPGLTLASNTGWGGNVQIATAAAWVGAFSWGGLATADSAILTTLPPGAYTAQVSGASGDSGVALVEVYEVQ